MNKKGVAWEQIFKAIIMVLVLITVFLIFFGGIKGPKETLAEGISNIVNKAKDVFKVLQEPTVSTDVDPKKFAKLSEEQRDKVVSQTKEKAENLGCNVDNFRRYIILYEDQIKNCKGIKNSKVCEDAVSESYSRIVKCYSTLKKCDEAFESYKQFIDNSKVANLLSVAREDIEGCYKETGQEDKLRLFLAEAVSREPSLAEKLEVTSELKKIRDKVGGSPEEIYKSALTDFDKGSYQGTIKKLERLKTGLAKIDFEIKDPALKETIVSLPVASDYWIKKAEFKSGELNCELLQERFSGYILDESYRNFRFPIKKTSYFEEPIAARMAFDAANCFMDRNFKGDGIVWKSQYQFILVNYNRNSIPVLITEMKDKVMTKEGCNKYGGEAPSCNSLNSDWASVNEIGNVAHEFRCWWKDEWGSGTCISCTEIKRCQDYGNNVYGKNPLGPASTCKDDPCGFGCLHKMRGYGNCASKP